MNDVGIMTCIRLPPSDGLSEEDCIFPDRTRARVIETTESEAVDWQGMVGNYSS